MSNYQTIYIIGFIITIIILIAANIIKCFTESHIKNRIFKVVENFTDEDFEAMLEQCKKASQIDNTYDDDYPDSLDYWFDYFDKEEEGLNNKTIKKQLNKEFKEGYKLRKKLLSEDETFWREQYEKALSK